MWKCRGILKAAFQFLFGKTKAPVETLCKTLKSSWKSLDLSDFRFSPPPACYRSAVDPLLVLLDERLLPENMTQITRGDYKEFFELAKACLGGSAKRKKSYTYQLSRPGAYSHARWISKCLFILKFSLLKKGRTLLLYVHCTLSIDSLTRYIKVLMIPTHFKCERERTSHHHTL